MTEPKVTVNTLRRSKDEGGKIVALTAYDFPFARLIDAAGVDVILVGDSLGMTFRGEQNTLAVTIDEMVYHTRAVRRGVTRGMLVADMPFLSYHVSDEKGIENAGKLIAAGAEGVKLEGADPQTISVIQKLVAAGIPVMGHIGLTPQSVHQLGGFMVQGKKSEEAKKIIAQAKALDEAGVFAMVIEAVPSELAATITGSVSVPTIGIGAGVGCDGQILVTDDLLGINPTFVPKFVKKFADVARVIDTAVKGYAEEVRSNAFPAAEQSYQTTVKRLKAM